MQSLDQIVAANKELVEAACRASARNQAGTAALAACTPAALHWLEQLIEQAVRDGCDVDSPAAWREMIASNRALLAGLKKAAAAGGKL